MTLGQVNFGPPPMLSQWENIEMLLSSSKPMGSVQIFQDHTIGGHLWWWRYNFSSVASARSSEVTKGLLWFFINCALQNEDRDVKQAPMCFSCPYASNDIRNDLFQTYHDLDLRSNFQIDLLRSSYISFEPAWWEKYNGAKILTLASIDKAWWAKAHFLEKWPFWLLTSGLTLDLWP